MNDIVLEVLNLKKYYGLIRGVENVSIKLYRGEVYGFIGPNGAGKSTTIKSIMNMLTPNDGKILLNGKILDKNDLDSKRIIGYLPSEVHLYSDLTVKQTLDFHESFYPQNLHKRRKELVKLLKVDESKTTEELSLGNLKKVGIILALMHEPEILILDEPTSGLDPVMQKVFYDLLEEEKKKGTTILYSTHVLSEVTKICDRVGIIKDGVMIREDLVENLEHNELTYLTIESNDINKIKKELKLKIVSESDNQIKFVNNLEPNELNKVLVKYDISKLLIEELPIEDVFMEYYK